MEADNLESAVRETFDHWLDSPRDPRLIVAIEDLIRLREEASGDAPDDLIWALSLKIHLLLGTHTIDAAREAAKVGERRLELRRSTLRAHSDELARSLRELSLLYSFENESFAPDRARSLDEEARTLEAAWGESHVR
jgi:hypothetical protein